LSPVIASINGEESWEAAAKPFCSGALDVEGFEHADKIKKMVTRRATHFFKGYEFL
jgi:hypothetical protein